MNLFGWVLTYHVLGDMNFSDFFGKSQESSEHYCKAQGPPTVYTPADDASASLGVLRWSKKLKGETNYSSAEDADIRLEESHIEIPEDAEISTRILKITDQLSIAVSYGADPKKGFGLMLKVADQPEFGWDWFYFAEGDTETAHKLQEEGKLKVEFAEVEGKSEIIRLKFETDVCLRGYAISMSVFFKIFAKTPDSRLLIKRGSDIQIPVLHDGKVTLLLSGA
ncbi:MAG TPA: hypothetical protein VK171_06030 [Fimbriimonas sp.]|nr:hypothetical protein [Fimbriimonas sp.]